MLQRFFLHNVLSADQFGNVLQLQLYGHQNLCGGLRQSGQLFNQPRFLLFIRLQQRFMQYLCLYQCFRLRQFILFRFKKVLLYLFQLQLQFEEYFLQLRLQQRQL
jgi:hypothetical protein